MSADGRTWADFRAQHPRVAARAVTSAFTFGVAFGAALCMLLIWIAR